MRIRRDLQKNGKLLQELSIKLNVLQDKFDKKSFLENDQISNLQFDLKKFYNTYFESSNYSNFSSTTDRKTNSNTQFISDKRLTKKCKDFIIDLQSAYFSSGDREYVPLETLRLYLNEYSDFYDLLSTVRHLYPDLIKLEIDNQGQKLIKVSGDKPYDAKQIR
jgi:hypothetical protein